MSSPFSRLSCIYDIGNTITAMRSKVVLMMSIVTIIAIPGKLAVSRPDESDVLHVPTGSLGRCPPHNITSEYFQITVLRSMTPMLIGGCAYIQHNPNEMKRQSFSLWIGNFKNPSKHCCEKNYINMEHYHFNCLIKPPSSFDDYNKRHTSVSLYQVITSHQTEARKVHSKCAMYNVIKGNDTMFRMAISGNSSCTGLLDLLTHPKPIYPNDKDGYMFLRFNKYPN